MSSSAMEPLFNKSVVTMVRGIRAHRGKEQAEYITKCLAEIKTELKSNDGDVKVEAMRKLIHLANMNYSMAWAAFHVIEIMSLPWFGHKQIGYLAASISFTDSTDLILLTTNLFKKAFQTGTMVGMGASTTAIAEGLFYEAGAALNCLANIATKGLAQDLLTDIHALLGHSHPYIRKKAILTLYRLFIKYPKGLRLSFDLLTDRLTDTHPSVVSAAVYVLCELAARNPKDYLSLAPQFFQILTTSSNNWVLIKVVKLLGSLVPFEPRLAKKLQEPLTEIITTTPAKSLLYECVNTLLSGQITSKAVVRLCLDKLRTFIEDPDQNLKYLGLLGLHRLIQAFPRVVVEHKDLILDCLDDDDVTIRMRALDLVSNMVSARNLPGVVRRLVAHLHNADGSYRDVVLGRIIDICAQDSFAYVADFEWYVLALLDLTRIENVSRANALRIQQQLVELLVRVPALRPFGVAQMSQLLIGGRLMHDTSASTSSVLAASSSASVAADRAATSASAAAAGAKVTSAAAQAEAMAAVLNTQTTLSPMSEVLGAAAFVIGEYSQHAYGHVQLLKALLADPAVPALSPAVQASFVQALPKILWAGLQQPFFADATAAQQWERAQHAETAAAASRGAELKKEQEAEAAASPEVEFDPLAAINLASPSSPTAADDTPATLTTASAAGAGVNGSPSSAAAAAADAGPLGGAGTRHVAVTAVGHSEHVGRTYAEHIAFISEMFTIVLTHLPRLAASPHIEVQERAAAYLRYLRWLLATKAPDAVVIEPSLLRSFGEVAVSSAAAAAGAAALLSPSAPEPSPSSASAAAAGAGKGPGALPTDLFAAASAASADTTAGTGPASLLVSPEGTSAATAGGVSFTPATQAQLLSVTNALYFLFADPLQPVAVGARAQRKVPLPPSLDLDTPINPNWDKAPSATDSAAVAAEGFVGFTDQTHPLFPLGPSTAVVSSSTAARAASSASSSAAAATAGAGATTAVGRGAAGKGGALAGMGSAGGAVHGAGGGVGYQPSPEEVEAARREREARKATPFYLSDDKVKKGAGKKGAKAAAAAAASDETIFGSPSSGGKGKGGAAAAVQDAIDLDFDDVGRKAGRSKGKARILRDATTATADDDDDIFEMALGAPSTTATAGAGAGKKVGKKSKKTEATPTPAPVAAPVAAAAPEAPTKVKKTKKASTKTAAAAAPAPVAGFVPTPAHVLVLTMPGVSVYALAKALPPAAGAVATPSCALAVTVAASKPVAGLELALAPNTKAAVKPFQGAPVPPKANIATGADGKTALVQVRGLAAGEWVTAPLAAAWTVPGVSPKTLRFTASARAAFADSKETAEGVLAVPLAAFITPHKLSMAEFAAILSSPTSRCAELASATVTLTRLNIGDAVRAVETVLRVQLVEAANFTAAYYGRYTLDPAAPHVCVYLKSGDGGKSVLVDVKTSAKPMSDMLIKELLSVIG